METTQMMLIGGVFGLSLITLIILLIIRSSSQADGADQPVQQTMPDPNLVLNPMQNQPPLNTMTSGTEDPNSNFVQFQQDLNPAPQNNTMQFEQSYPQQAPSTDTVPQMEPMQIDSNDSNPVMPNPYNMQPMDSQAQIEQPQYQLEPQIEQGQPIQQVIPTQPQAYPEPQIQEYAPTPIVTEQVPEVETVVPQINYQEPTQDTNPTPTVQITDNYANPQSVDPIMANSPMQVEYTEPVMNQPMDNAEQPQGMQNAQMVNEVPQMNPMSNDMNTAPNMQPIQSPDINNVQNGQQNPVNPININLPPVE